MIELGPVNKTIHQVNECVALADLKILSNIYYSVCVKLLNNPGKERHPERSEGSPN